MTLLIAGISWNNARDEEYLEQREKGSKKSSKDRVMASPVKSSHPRFKGRPVAEREPTLRPSKPFKQMTSEEYQRFLSGVGGV